MKVGSLKMGGRDGTLIVVSRDLTRAVKVQDTAPNRDRTRGCSCIAERRMIEIIEKGTPVTPFMRFGDRVRIEMFDPEGHSIFGAIGQKVIEYKKP